MISNPSCTAEGQIIISATCSTRCFAHQHSVATITASSSTMYLPRILPFLAAAATALPANQTAPGTIPGTTGHYVAAGGHKYYFLESQPAGSPIGTILLFHGFPDFSYAWRYQVPYFTSLGYRVIAPDLLGYANTDAPCDITQYALKKMSTDMTELLDQVAPGEKIIVGAHDWGAGLAYNFATWYPDYLKAYFTISVPYNRPWLGPALEWVDLLDLVENGTYPTLGYQLQWREIAINRNFTTRDQTRSFLNTGFGGLTPEGESALSSSEGLLYNLMPLLGNQSLVSAEDFEVYVDKISQKGLASGFNWYRTRRINWEDELPLAKKGPFKFTTPYLFIASTKDYFMPPELYNNTGAYFEDWTIESVDASHWSMWEKPDEVNSIIHKWLLKL